MSRGRTVLLVAGAVAFVIIGLLLVGAFGEALVGAFDRPRTPRFEVVVIGWVAIVFFGLCAIGWGKQLFESGVVMRIDSKGIYWRRWSEQTIPWSATERICPVQCGGNAS